MNRFVSLSNEPLVGENEVVIELSQAVVPTLALEMSLLLDGLAGSVRMKAPTGPSVVTVMGPTVASKAVLAKHDLSLFFELGRNQVEYLRATLLRAYRDGVADVNHVHIEGTDGVKRFDLTIMFDLHYQPMTELEALRLLDD